MKPGGIRYELGIQQREDALHRLVDVWATGEAAASLGFAAARLFDELDPLEKQKTAILRDRGIKGSRAEMKALRECEQRAIEMLSMPRNNPDRANLAADPLVDFVLKDSVANVFCPAAKLWNTGHGANMMREAVSLMGGYGITEDCPGFLASKWMDAQLEATYEGPEAVQRRQLTVTMTSRKCSWPSSECGSRKCARSPRRFLALAHVLLPPQCRCGCGRCRICNSQPTPKGISFITDNGKVSLFRWQMRFAGLLHRAARFSTCLSLRHAVAKMPPSVKDLPGQFSSSVISATRKRHRRLGKFRKSAQNASSLDTTNIRAGTTRVA